MFLVGSLSEKDEISRSVMVTLTTTMMTVIVGKHKSIIIQTVIYILP